jgi:heme-degrading monooxygenase HmoA
LFETRNEEEKLAVSESGQKIAQEMLSIPGFISVVMASVGDRMMTITAWDNSDSMAPLMKSGEHRVAVGRYFQSELGGRGGNTGIWIPGRLNPRRVRCNDCSKMAPVRETGDRCSCGAMLPDPLAYW